MEEMEENVPADVMPDLRINGKDAFAEWGVHMGEGFLDTLFAPPKLKDFIENQSRQIDGKVVLHGIPKLDARDLTLAFTVEGGADAWRPGAYRGGELRGGLGDEPGRRGGDSEG